MICPKCSYIQADNRVECERCGIIFAKFHAIRQRKNNRKAEKQTSATQNSQTSADTSFIRLMLYVKDDINLFYWGGRLLIFIGMIWYSIRFSISPLEANTAGSSLLHLVNLPFHEAGHIFLRPFGSFMTSLGGSLFQMLVPLICLFVLLFQTRDTFGASVAFWWFGENFYDLAPYINDARSLSMPLIGGNYGHSSPYGFHDWEYILTEMGLQRYDHLFAGTSIAIGSLIFIFSLSWGAIILYKQFHNLE